MMKISVLFVLSVVPVLHAEDAKEAAPAAAPVEAPASAPSTMPAANEEKLSAEEILRKLIKTAKAELAEYNKTPENRGWSLDSFFSGLERQSPHGGFRSAAAAKNFMDAAFPDGEGFAESKALAKAYVDQLDIEIGERRKLFEENYIRSLSALMMRTVETENPKKLGMLDSELDEFFRYASQTASRLDDRGENRSSSISSDHSNFSSLVTQLSSFHSYRAAEQWSSASSTLETLEKQLPRLERYLPADAAKSLIARWEKSIGQLPTEEVQAMFNATVAELLDSKNQDRLAEIQRTIRKQVDLCRNSSKSAFSEEWQDLSAMATSLSQSITRMRQGNPPQASPEQWIRVNPNAAEIIGREKLVDAMKRYQVKWRDSTGQDREEPIYYDMDEVVARIQSPADIARELPVFNKAVKQSSYSSDGGVNWQGLGQRLQQYADLFAKLESGSSFSLGSYNGSEYGYERSANAGGDDAASKKAADLNQQLQWMIVQRFHPEVTADPQSTPARAVADLFAQAKKNADYQSMLNLGKLSAYLTPGQGLLGSQDAAAIQFYLNGVKQEEELDQPRLATYYFQRAAAIPNSPIPSSVFKARLKTLKRNSPKEYDKGTDDALGGNIDASSPILQATLVVPAKPTP